MRSDRLPVIIRALIALLNRDRPPLDQLKCDRLPIPWF
jgi:hypothetical protein